MTISIDPGAERASVRPAEAADAERLARALTQAFYDDPVFRWFWPRENDGRFASMERFFARTALGSTQPHGAVYTTDAVAGGALWLPPAKSESSTWETVRGLPEVVRLSGRDVVRFLRGLARLAEHHPHDDHWYLMFVGVSPGWQGAGIGSALMQPILDRADADGMPAYLDATSPRNRRLYERHGFVVMREYELPDGPPVWAMWREPR